MRHFGGLLIKFFSNKTLFLLNKKWSSIGIFIEGSSIGKGSTIGVRTNVCCSFTKFFNIVPYKFQNSWTLWFFKPDKVDRNKKWEDCQRSIITFNTVEDFWALYNHIELASKLNAGCDYSLFKVS